LTITDPSKQCRVVSLPKYHPDSFLKYSTMLEPDPFWGRQTHWWKEYYDDLRMISYFGGCYIQRFDGWCPVIKPKCGIWVPGYSTDIVWNLSDSKFGTPIAGEPVLFSIMKTGIKCIKLTKPYTIYLFDTMLETMNPGIGYGSIYTYKSKRYFHIYHFRGHDDYIGISATLGSNLARIGCFGHPPRECDRQGWFFYPDKSVTDVQGNSLPFGPSVTQSKVRAVFDIDSYRKDALRIALYAVIGEKIEDNHEVHNEGTFDVVGDIIALHYSDDYFEDVTYDAIDEPPAADNPEDMEPGYTYSLASPTYYDVNGYDDLFARVAAPRLKYEEGMDDNK